MHRTMRAWRLVLRSNKAHSLACIVGPLFLFLSFSVVVDTLGHYPIVFSSRLFMGKCWIVRAYPNGIVTPNRPCLLCPIVMSDCWRRSVAMPRIIVIHTISARPLVTNTSGFAGEYPFPLIFNTEAIFYTPSQTHSVILCRSIPALSHNCVQ